MSLVPSQAGAAVGPCAPQLSVREEVVSAGPGSLIAQYVVTTGDLCGLQLVALAVDNNASLAAFSNLSGWNSMVVTDNFWDAGIVLSRDDFGSMTSYLVTTGPQGIGSFTSFFGPGAELANLYWLSAHYGGPVVDHSTGFTATGTPIPLPGDAFFFEARSIASRPVFMLHDPALGTTVALVPEPAAWLLFATGCLAFLAMGRVRSPWPSSAQA